MLASWSSLGIMLMVKHDSMSMAQTSSQDTKGSVLPTLHMAVDVLVQGLDSLQVALPTIKPDTDLVLEVVRVGYVSSWWSIPAAQLQGIASDDTSLSLGEILSHEIKGNDRVCVPGPPHWLLPCCLLASIHLRARQPVDWYSRSAEEMLAWWSTCPYINAAASSPPASTSFAVLGI